MKRPLILTLLLSFALLFSTSDVDAQRKRYSGKRHTTSHGGYYKSGKGSSHKGGHYRNAKTNNHYGKHKR